MKILHEGRRFVTDPVEAIRISFLVEETDVGTTLENYLGSDEYTFVKDDVGRLAEAVQDMSPNFESWRFGSIFCDLRKQYPDPKPYVKVE